MNSWTLVGEFIDFDGVTPVNPAPFLDNKASPSITNAVVNSAGNNVYFADGGAVAPVNGPSASNHCWTAVDANPQADANNRVVIAGFVGSITTCLKHAIDGYSFWGTAIIARLGADWAAGSFDDASSSLAVTETYDAANDQIIS